MAFRNTTVALEANMEKRFIATPIMSEAAVQAIKKQLEARGQEFAHIEDAVKAVMRVAADQTINGSLTNPMYSTVAEFYRS